MGLLSFVDDVVNATGLGGLVGGLDLSGKKAGERALNYQRGAAGEAQDVMMQYLNPYEEAGRNALTSLAGGKLNIENTPAYQFRMQEGLKALSNSMAARGGGNSGRAMKELTRFGQGLASQEYGNEFNRLSSLAGMGQNAATTLASGRSNLISGLGNAQASNEIARANRDSQFLSSLISGGTALATGGFSIPNSLRSLGQYDFAY